MIVYLRAKICNYFKLRKRFRNFFVQYCVAAYKIITIRRNLCFLNLIASGAGEA